MTPHMRDFIHSIGWHAPMNGPILEIGSMIETNQQGLDLRQAFPHGTPYIGVDRIARAGVDKVVDAMDLPSLLAIGAEIKPQTILCLYVVEHVWEIRRFVENLGALWQQHQNAWLLFGTHQNQPYHGTGDYEDYWRLTRTGMMRLADENGLSGSALVVHPDMSNPTDLVIIRHPASFLWSAELLTQRVFPSCSTHWEQVR